MTFPVTENLVSPSKVSSLMTSLIYPLGSRVVLPLYFESINIVGLEHFPVEGPLLIAPTHRSRWDGLIVGYGLGRPSTGRDLRYMVSVNEMQGPQGWLIRQFGGFAIDPDAPSIRKIRHGVVLLVNQDALVVFGEGDIFRDRTVHHLKPGLSRIALQAQRCLERRSHPFGSMPVKVLPVGLHYSQSCPKRGCAVELRIGKPLCVADYITAPCKEAAAALTMDLKIALNRLMEDETQISIAQVSAQPS